MNALEDLLASLGVNDPRDREKLKYEIESCAVEMAIAKLVTQKLASDDELNVIAQIYEGGKLEQSTFEALFNTQQRQQILQQSLTEAIKVVVNGTQAAAK